MRRTELDTGTVREVATMVGRSVRWQRWEMGTQTHDVTVRRPGHQALHEFDRVKRRHESTRRHLEQLHHDAGQLSLFGGAA